MPSDAESRLFFAIVVAGAALGASGCYAKHERDPIPRDAVADTSMDASVDTRIDSRPPDTLRDTATEADACDVEDCYCANLEERPECIPCAVCIL